VASADLDVVRRAYSLYNAGEAERAARECFHEDVVLIRRPLGEPEAYEGLEGLRRAHAEAESEFANYRMEPERFFVMDERVVVAVRVSGTDPGSGVEALTAAAHVVELRDERVVRWEVFLDLDEALAAVDWDPERGEVVWATG
jgi:ketosteroid isomerase-like protein